MSALEELWLWLQGRKSTEAGPETIDAVAVEAPRQQAGEINQDDASVQQADDAEARIQRNYRYRAGPWQMK